MFEIAEFTSEHIDGIMEVEQNSFSVPWTREDFVKEASNPNAIYFVALCDGEVVGYGGMWHIVNEGHITNIAVRPDFRRQGVGKLIMEALEAAANKLEMVGLTLEVRMGNEAAFAMYRKYGFFVEGIRKNYYGTNEDALIMWRYFPIYEDYENTPNYKADKEN